MPADFIAFGNRDRFEIAVRARHQRDAATRWPAEYGWSLGDIRITVGGRVLTENVRDGRPCDHATWYLLPVFEWLAVNWIALLHEEEFSWAETSPAAAATVVPRVVGEVLGRDDDAAVRRYDAALAWRERHALRTAANGGLLPDLYVRRFLDSIELSWTDAAPMFAPDGFRFVSRPGYASCSVAEVAIPLWDALDEVASGLIGKPRLAADEPRFAALGERLAALRRLDVLDFAAARVAPGVLAAALAHLGDDRSLFDSVAVNDNVPAIAAFSPAIAMYGGMSPHIGIADVRRLSDVALAARQRPETPALARLTADQGGIPRTSPYLEGYRLAEGLLDELDLDDDGSVVDIAAIIAALAIEVVEAVLDTDTVRGVGLAGSGIGPTIVINRSSVFNSTLEGRRFTLAHELCHILYDRGRARRVGVTSGPWAPAAVERRANAFAAALLMPRDRVVAAFEGTRYADSTAVDVVAQRMEVGRRALVEHLHNLHLIDENERERLRYVIAD